MGYMCTHLNNEIIVCMLSVLFFFGAVGLRYFASWRVQKLQDVAKRSGEHFKIWTRASMKMSKQKVAVEENWIKGKVITGLTSTGSVSVCPGCSGVLEVFLDAFEMLLCVCVLKQKKCTYIFLNKVLCFLDVLFSD